MLIEFPIPVTLLSMVLVTSKAFAEVTGGKVNRGGYGPEVPSVYRLYGPKVYIEKMRELVNSLRTAGLL